MPVAAATYSQDAAAVNGSPSPNEGSSSRVRQRKRNQSSHPSLSPSSKSPTKSSFSDASSSTSTGGIDKLAPFVSESIQNRHRRMLRRMITLDRLERQEQKALQELRGRALSELTWKYVQVIGLLLLMTAAFVLYARPTFLYGFKSLQSLTPRFLMVLYPDEISIKRQLPRFTGRYSVATPDNEEARQALQKVEAMREYATRSGLVRRDGLRQEVHLFAWEHADFRSKLAGQAYEIDKKTGKARMLQTRTANDALMSRMDQVCGAGFRDAYYKLVRMQTADHQRDAKSGFMRTTTTSGATDGLTPVQRQYKDDLVRFCLLRTGTHDGFVGWNVTVLASLTRGLHGLAAQYVGEQRIFSDLILLPLLPPEVLLNQSAVQAVAASSSFDTEPSLPTPSTWLPQSALDWLLTNETIHHVSHPYRDLHQAYDYRMKWETFLYQAIEYDQKHSSVRHFALQQYESQKQRQGVAAMPQQRGPYQPWILLNAACTAEQRAMLQSQQQRLVATTCSDATRHHESNLDPSSVGSDGNDPHADQDQLQHPGGELESCCSIYDPYNKPFILRRDD